MKAEVHVMAVRGRWTLDVEGVRFGPWPRCRALRLALKTAREVSVTPGVVAKVVLHEADGRVLCIHSFGGGSPLRLRRRRPRLSFAQARLPLALAARYQRDLERFTP